jgi:predicted nucleic acid-binding protein
MIEPVFVDTNVLVYRFDAAHPEKQRAAEAWLERLWETRTGRLSFQVLREFYITVTKKLAGRLDSGQARLAVRSLLAWHPAPSSSRIIETAWDLEDRHSVSWWDALIIAAAQEQSCSILLTEDLQEDQRFGSLRVVNPFSTTPDDV